MSRKKSNKSITSESIELAILATVLSQEQIDSIVATLNPVEVVESTEVVVPNLNVHVATSLEYIKWAENSDEEVVHIGVMTVEDEDTVTLLTKYGEMTFMKDDGIFSPSSRTEFEEVVIPVKEVVEKQADTGLSKMSRATLIYQEMIKVATNRRIDIIKRIMAECDMNLAGASTYHQNIKVKLNKSN